MAKTWLKLIGSVAGLAIAVYSVVANSYNAGINAAAEAILNYGKNHLDETFEEFFRQEN